MAASEKSTIWTRNFICVLITNCMLVLSHTSVNTLVTTYTTYLGAGPRLMGLLTGLFFGVALAMRPVAGPVTTRVDNRRLMLFVYSLGCIVNLGYAMFHSIPGFMFFRVLNGFQYAFVGSLGITIAAESLPKEKLSSGLGVYGVGGSIASSIAPRIGLGLHALGSAKGDEDLGFTFVFLFAALALAVGLIPSALMRPMKKSAAQRKNAGKWYQTIVSGHALIPSTVVLLLTVSYSLYNSYMVPYGKELGIADVGLFFTVLALGMLAARPLFGSLSDRVGAWRVFLPGVLLFALSFLSIGFAKDMKLLLLGAVLGAAGYGAANPTIQSMTMQTEPKLRGAVASNTLYIGMDLGFFLGPVIGGYIKAAGTFRDILRFGFLPAILAAALFLLNLRRITGRMAAVQELEAAD